MSKYTVGSLFSGIGGLDLAAHWAGFNTEWFVEKEPFCQKVLVKHWPNVPIHSDIFDCHDLPYVDVVCGGFPCQPFSTSGRRRGKNDERYLLPEMLRIVDEVKPYAVLFENVQNFPKLDNGDGFKYLLRTITEMGYDAEWGHLFASNVGSPHPRERWFCVAYSNGAGIQRKRQTVEYPPRETGQPQIRRNVIDSCETSGANRSRDIKSRLGGNAYGLPGRLDFVGWPAGRKQRQFAYGPPRLAIETTTTKARQVAIGNAVVPQVAYPIFAALADWLNNGKPE